MLRNVARDSASDLVLAGAVVLQFVVLAFSLRPVVLRVTQFRGAPATERSARIAFGDQFGDFIHFLETSVPQAGRVVIPPMDLDSTLGDVGLMQYLLFPREIVNCPSGEDLPRCVRSLTGERTYILRVGDFPAPEDVPLSKEYVPFAADWGLYCPR